MFCKNCGVRLAEDSKFCSHCGTKVDDVCIDPIDESKEACEETVVEPVAEETIPVENEKSEAPNGTANKLFVGGFVCAAFGAALFLSIVLISLIGWGKIYLYGGYDFTAALTTISLVCMIPGFVLLAISLILNRRSKAASIKLLEKKAFSRWSVVLLVLCVVFSTLGILDYVDENSGSSSGSSSGGSYGGYADTSANNSGVSKRLGLSLKVEKIEKSGSYTYVYCTVKNVSSKYEATRYRYVKVKAQFKDSSGTVVDTDWTYAVDSAWLEPGESKTFYYMVKNTGIKSATLSFLE